MLLPTMYDETGQVVAYHDTDTGESHDLRPEQAALKQGLAAKIADLTAAADAAAEEETALAGVTDLSVVRDGLIAVAARQELILRTLAGLGQLATQVLI